MFKKFGFLSVIVGIISLAFSIPMLDSSKPYKYWGYSSGTRTIMELGPMLFMGFGVLLIISGIFFISYGMKPILRKQAKVVEKNGTTVILEFEDGTRKKLVAFGNVSVLNGDVGTVGYQGSFIIEFNKLR